MSSSLYKLNGNASALRRTTRLPNKCRESRTSTNYTSWDCGSTPRTRARSFRWIVRPLLPSRPGSIVQSAVSLFGHCCADTVAASFPPSRLANCCVTSPAHWKKRNYNAGPHELGQEPTIVQYADNLLSVIDEIYRVLTPNGTFWLNLGDTYATQAGTSRGTLLPFSRRLPR